jgi:uncharacterized protein YecE (DUF72 family)
MSLWLRIVARHACSLIDRSTAADTLNWPWGPFKYRYQNLYFWLGSIRKWPARRLVAGNGDSGERRVVANMQRSGKVYTGTSGWAYASWKPKFYPAKLTSKKFLEYYATRLNSVEVNYTFRRLPGAELLAGWVASTPDEFQFAVKAHQSITHFKRLRGVAETTADFFASVEPLHKAGKLGPALFQLPPNFKCDLERLKDFLRLLPCGRRTAIEFRHESWFAEEVYELLRGNNVALCLAESDEFETPEVATANFSYFRLRKEQYPPRACKEIKQRVEKAAKRGDVFAYYKHEETPEGALYAEGLLRSMGQDCGRAAYGRVAEAPVAGPALTRRKKNVRQAVRR